jgi:DNA-binding PadR family transcriptional regulator
MPVDRLGGFEELVLLATASLNGEGYGVSIQEQLESESAQVISVGAVYAALDRLERKGYVHSRMGGATRERGGRRKRMYRATASGLEALKWMQRIRLGLWSAIESLEAI